MTKSNSTKLNDLPAASEAQNSEKPSTLITAEMEQLGSLARLSYDRSYVDAYESNGGNKKEAMKIASLSRAK